MPCKVRNRGLCLRLALALSLLASNALPALTALGASHTPEVRLPGVSRVDSEAARPVTDPALRARAAEAFGKLPLQFEENAGQTDARARFISRGPNFTLFLTSTDAVLSLPSADGKSAAALRMRLAGANGRAALGGEEQLPWRVNYFAGGEPSRWRTNVATYGKVRYANVYDGVDMIYYGNQQGLEYDFRIAPGADAKRIALRFEGARRASIDAAGDLVLRMAEGVEVRQHKPFVYQEWGGGRREVACSYLLKANGAVGFRLGDYDHALPLVIDPTINYSTLLGGSDNDTAYAVAADSDGSVYVAGNAHSAPFPVTPGAYQTDGSSPITGAAFVSKLNPTGTALVYSTYLGKGSSDEVRGIVPDAAGNVIVAGNTNHGSQFPTTPGAYQSGGGGDDVFVTKLNATGTALIYSTLFGGNSIDNVRSLAVDAGGNAYFAGYTISDNFPTTPGAYRTTKPTQEEDSYVASLNATGTALNYSTLIHIAENYGIAVDASGSAYVTGYTTSHIYPTTPGAYQGAVGGNGRIAFITKVNPTGTGLDYSTTVGGFTNNGSFFGVQPFAIALDSGNNAYITGLASTTTPTTPGALSTGGNLFVVKMNAAGSALVYGARFGGAGATGKSIAVDAAGNAYVAGSTDTGANFTTTADAFQKTSGGNGEGFLAILNPTASAITYATLFGGDGNDSANAVALDANNAVYVAGNAQKNGATKIFPTTAGAFQTAYGGNSDAFVVKFNGSGATTPTPTPTPTPTSTPTPTPTPTSTPTPTPTPGSIVQFSSATYDVSEGSGSSGTSGATFGEAGEYEAALAASAGGSALITVTRSDSTQAASVDYATQDGTASGRSDYTASFGTLRFATGETTKTLLIPVTDDRFLESQETFSVTLSNPNGVELGAPSTATVRVTSDDASDGPSPVRDGSFDVDFFVRQHYADFLGREADADGLDFWKSEITQCEARPAAERQGCREVKRINVSAAFFLSIEFQETGYFVYRFQQAAFNTGERLRLRDFTADRQEVGRGVAVGQTNWQQQLEQNKQAYAELFVIRPAFLALYPTTMSSGAFVDALNVNTGGSLSQAERDDLAARLGSGQLTRAQVLRAVAEDADFKTREFNRAFVLTQYFGYLRRNPNDSPDADFSGYNFWLGKLNDFNGNYIAAEMIKAFISSDEYVKRFGQ